MSAPGDPGTRGSEDAGRPFTGADGTSGTGGASGASGTGGGNGPGGGNGASGTGFGSDAEILPRAAGPSGSSGGTFPEGISVGQFRQGSLGSQAALGTYLVGRVVALKIAAGLMVTALLILAIAAAVWFVGPHWLAVLLALLALPVLIARAVVRWFMDRITHASHFGSADGAVRQMIRDTRGDMRRELRRIGVPASMFSFPFLLLRLMRARSRRTLLERMRAFDIARVVPPSRVDELHMLITSTRPI